MEECKHEVVTRDISNMTTCVACGVELGFAFAAWDYPPSGGVYGGISRTPSQPEPEK